MKLATTQERKVFDAMLRVLFPRGYVCVAETDTTASYRRRDHAAPTVNLFNDSPHVKYPIKATVHSLSAHLRAWTAKGLADALNLAEAELRAPNRGVFNDEEPDDMSDHPEHPDNIAEIRKEATRLRTIAKLRLSDYDHALDEWRGNPTLSNAIMRDDAKRRSDDSAGDVRLAEWALDRLAEDSAARARETAPLAHAEEVYDIATLTHPAGILTATRYTLYPKKTGLARRAPKDYYTRDECKAFLDGWDARQFEDEPL